MRSVRIAARATAIALTLTLAVSFNTHSAMGAPRPEATPVQLQAARELFADATKDEEAGHWAFALEKLHRVADVKLTAGIRYHIALCEERLGQTATALSHYTEALQAARDEKNKEVAELLKDPFLPDLRARVPSITISVSFGNAATGNAAAGNAATGNANGGGDASSAEVLVDGQIHPAGLWGVPVPIDPGVHRVEAHAPGRRAFSTVVTVNDRDRSLIAVTLPSLQSAQNAAGAPEAAPSIAAPIASSSATHDAAPASDTSSARSHGSRGGAIAATAGAIVLAGGGVAAYLIAGSKQSDAQTECRALLSCDDRKGAIQTFDALALGAWIGAAALGVTAVVLWASPTHSDHPASAQPHVRMGVGPGSLRLEGSF